MKTYHTSHRIDFDIEGSKTSYKFGTQSTISGKTIVNILVPQSGLKNADGATTAECGSIFLKLVNSKNETVFDGRLSPFVYDQGAPLLNQIPLSFKDINWEASKVYADASVLTAGEVIEMQFFYE